MLNYCFKVFFIAILIITVCFKSNAQRKSLTYLGIENGLSNNAVTSIFQDHYGLMWFGTYDGLNQYNGYEFKVFRNKLHDSTSLIHNRIVTITEDAENRIWVGTKMGISIYDRAHAKFSSLYYRSANSLTTKKVDFTINDLETDRAGNVYIATAGKGLLCYKKGAKAAIQLKVMSQNPEVGNTHIQSVKIDQQQQVWAFVQGYGLYKLDKKSNSLILVSSTVKFGNALEADDQGHLWLGGDYGLYDYHIKKDTFTYHDALKKGLTGGNKIVGLTIDKSHKLWIATDGSGVAVLAPKTGSLNFLYPGEGAGSLKSAAVYAVFEDRDARKWIGTLRGGINIYDPNQLKFETIAHDPVNANSLLNNFVLSFCETRSGSLWIGTDGGGISYWDKQKNKFHNYKHQAGNLHSLANDNVTSILQDAQNRIWISTYGGGICRYRPDTDDFEQFDCFNGIYKYLNNNVWLLYLDRHNNLLAGTVNGAVYSFNHAAGKFTVYDNALMNVISLAEDRHGNLWAGTFDGLIKVDPLHHNNQLFKTDFPVRSIHEDTQQRLWVGTEGGGLLEFNKQTFEPATTKFHAYTSENGLSGNAVLNILEDHKGILWLSTFNGITQFNPKNKIAKPYYEADGLQSNQFNYNAALRLSGGELVFGGIKGFTMFHPDSLSRQVTDPRLLLTGMKINNKAYEEESDNSNIAIYDLKEITLPYDKTMLSIEFLALDYAAKDKIKYAYYLEGWDRDWNEAGKVRVANYSRLTEGTYILKIRSTNTEGLLNATERSIKIIVLPPWFRSWWAYLIYAFSTAGALYAFIHYKSSQARLRYQVHMANYQAEKEREMQEKKLSFFTNVSHEFRSPLTLIINPVKDLINNKEQCSDKSQLDGVYRNARRLLSLVDQLLLFTRTDSAEDILNVSKLNFPSFCREVYLCFLHQAKSKDVTYEFECTADEIYIYGDREKIEIILFNLISNALKFAPEGGTVKVALLDSENGIELRVSNNGPVIPVEIGNRLFDKYYKVKQDSANLKSGFGIGLYLVRNFAERHLALAGFTSEETETSFFVKFKKGNSHLPGLPISEDLPQTSYLFSELLADIAQDTVVTKELPIVEPEMVSDKQAILLIDDNPQIRDYVKGLFRDTFRIHEAENAETGLALLKANLPDLIICDVVMPGMSGVELCSLIKKDKSLSHIPIILLTGTDATDIKMKGFAEGADDYITKPFENDMLITRVNSILKRQQDLQQHFFNRITLKADQLKISSEDKDFLDRCIEIVELRLMDNEFNISVLAAELGMSHSSLYKHVKFISGQSVNSFIRFIRLRKAAALFIRTDHNVTEVAFQVGFSDIKYFREQFNKLFGYNPSEYIRKYRNTFNQRYHLNERGITQR